LEVHDSLIFTSKDTSMSADTAKLWSTSIFGGFLSILGIGILISAFAQNVSQPWISTPLHLLCTSRAHEAVTSTRVISTEPLLLYLHDFITKHEIQHLLSLSDPLFQRSLIKDGTVSPARTSESCFLPGNDTTVALVKRRAEYLMGGLAYDGVEAIQLVRYHLGQKVNLHFDWAQKPKIDRQGREYNRLASFFVYLKDDCTGGETWFPNVTVARGFGTTVQQGKDGIGISVRPSTGGGLFWMNLKNDGRGDRRTLHAGLPVQEGTKVGMNIWVKKLL
jgi:prolyl 4-hydroxylase